MKRIVVLVTCLLATATMHLTRAEQLDDIGRLCIQSYMPVMGDVPQEAATLLQSKLSQIITTAGIADNEISRRFILTAKVHTLSQDIVPGPPQRVSKKIEVVIMLADIIEDKVYASFPMELSGIGTNPNKALIAAFKGIRPASQDLQAFLETGKKKVIDYYETNGAMLISQARELAQQQKYEEAMCILSSIPDVVSRDYEESAQLSSEIYRKMIDARGAALLQQARAAWSSEPNKAGAQKAVALLQKINFAAACQGEAVLLMNSIKSKLVADEQREWEFQMQQYRDRVEKEKREWEHSVQVYKDNYARQQRLDAARAAERRMTHSGLPRCRHRVRPQSTESR